MRLATLCLRTGTRAARLDGDTAVLLPHKTVGDLLQHADWRKEAEAAGETCDMGSVRLGPPVLGGKVICVGRNYAAHAAEQGADVGEFPTLFSKLAETICGPCDDIEIPAADVGADHEVELAVIIGGLATRLAPAEAHRAIAGYAIANDISMRSWQRRTSQWFQGKNFERTTPLGPALVTGDECNEGRDLEIRCFVDGRERQRSRTSAMVFTPADLVSYISRFTTLRPGDVILTGSPPGVGEADTPPRFLQKGQIVRCEIDRLGTLENRIRERSE